MNMKTEEAPALSELREHLAKVDEVAASLAKVTSAAAIQRDQLKGLQASMPNIAALEKAECDALAALALGEADSAGADAASAQLSEARVIADTLRPQIRTAESTISGLERKTAEVQTALAKLKAAGPAVLLAYLKEEMEAEAARYVRAASSLIRHHSRLRALGAMAAELGLQPHQAGSDLKLVIGRMGWLRAFEGHQDNPNNPKLIYDAAGPLPGQAGTQAAKKEEIDRLLAELGVNFRAVAENLKAGA